MVERILKLIFNQNLWERNKQRAWGLLTVSSILNFVVLTIVVSPTCAQLANGPWSMYQHDPQHTGRSEYVGPQTNNIRWTSDIITDSLHNLGSSQPIVGADGTIYLTVGDNQDASVGELYAINPDGTIKWQLLNLEGRPGIPAIGLDGTIYFQTLNGIVYAINSDKSEKWKFNCEGAGTSQGITIGPDGTLYVTPRFGLYAINPNGTEKWYYQIDYLLREPAVGQDGTIYVVYPGFVGMWDSQYGFLHALRPDGTVKWTKGLRGYKMSAPSVGSDGTIYVAGTYLYAYDPNNGEMIWKTPIKGNEGAYYYQSLTPVITSSGAIIAGVTSQPNHGTYYAIRAYTPSGGVLWTFDESDEKCGYPLLNPVIDGEGTMFTSIPPEVLGGDVTRIYWVDSDDGTVKITLDISGRPSAYSLSPLALGDSGYLYTPFIFSGTYDLKLYSIGSAILENLPPTASFTYSPESPTVGEEVTFDASDSYDPDEYIEDYAWSFYNLEGDYSEPGSGKITKFSYPSPGTYKVSLCVSDNNQALDSTSKEITIEPTIGYAIIVAGKGGLTNRRWFGHSTDNAYRVLRNLGFDDNQIFYLNSQRELEISGKKVVDAPASVDNFEKYLNEIKDKIGDNSTPFILYLVGHGDRNIFLFDPENEAVEHLIDADLRHMLEDAHFDPALIVIWSCNSGSFITRDFADDSISVEGKRRIIITATHEDDILRMYDLARSSDRFWGNLNEGLNVKETFVRNATKLDINHRLLDDNGDEKGSPPNNLGQDGNLAVDTVIGMAGTEELELVDWYWALIHSCGELRVYDSQNRVTGLVNGEVKKEIPDSIYDEQDKVVAIFSASNSYRYRVVGIQEGTYGLDIGSIKGSEANTFTATDIPTSPGAIHQYTINWNTLSKGEEGVTVQMDSDGDGTFELTFTTGTTLVSMTPFVIDHAKIDFKKKPDDDKVSVKGSLELNLVNGDGVDISEEVIVKVGPLSETIKMEEKGKKGEKWEYKRPKHGTGDIKKMSIDWKKGKFDIRMDKADLSSISNPVTISIQIRDDVGQETILMEEKDKKWEYKAGKAKGSITIKVEEGIAQLQFSLYQNYPNPFNPETTIEYSLPEGYHVMLKIYNIAGQLVKTLINEYQQAGSYTIIWYGHNDVGEEVARGLYFYQLQAGDFVSTKKMVVLK